MKTIRILVIALLAAVPAWSYQNTREPKSTKGQAQPENSRGVLWAQITDSHWNEIPRMDTTKMYVITQVVQVSPANGICYSNACAPKGCASCVNLAVSIPSTATVIQQNCWTTADINDGPIRALPNCLVDAGWSAFDPPLVTLKHDSSGNVTGKVVTTTYHNRSHNRSRAVAFEVYYTP